MPSKKQRAKMTTCNICLDEKSNDDIVERTSNSKCVCSFEMCVDCSLKCTDRFQMCSIATCTSMHMDCPQCSKYRGWDVMEDRRVLDSSTRMGILLKRVREQYEEDENWYRAAQKEIGNLKRLNAGLIERLKKK
jgi:hypothetical protein